jgi:hypothetical protein
MEGSLNLTMMEKGNGTEQAGKMLEGFPLAGLSQSLLAVLNSPQ